MAETKGRDASRNNVVVKVRFVMHPLFSLCLSLFALYHIQLLDRDYERQGETLTALLIYAPESDSHADLDEPLSSPRGSSARGRDSACG